LDKSKPIQQDIQLKPGVWISGKVVNRKTGAGQPNVTVHYSPFRNNQFVRSYKAFDPAILSGITNSRRFMTNESGEYRVLGIPGRGVAMGSCKKGSFLTGVGWETIEKFQRRDSNNSVTFAILNPQSINSVALVEVAERTGVKNLQLEVDPGSQITLNVIDSDGDEVSNFLFSGDDHRITSPNRTSKNSKLEIQGLKIGDERPVLMRHEERGIGAVMKLNLDENSPSERTVQLLSIATVKGQIIDQDGQPAKNVQVRIGVETSIPNYMIILGTVFTDENGRFKFDKLLPGGEYRIVSIGGPKRFATLIDSLDPKPGEKIDLGTIDVTKTDRPEPMRTE
jgi:hypothetical protein